MADVDMPDAGSAGPAKSKAAGKAKTGLGEGNSEGKKKFEVKKVYPLRADYMYVMLTER